METQDTAARAAQAPLNQNFLDAEKDKPRGQTRVKMRVVNRKTLALPVLENMIGIGERDITVYAPDVPKVVAMVETEPHKIAQAEEAFEREIAEDVIERMRNYDGTVDDIIPVLRARTNPEVNGIYDRLMKSTGKSMEGTFQRLHKRSLKPLVSAEVIKDSEHAEPQREALSRETQKLAEAIGIALAKQSGGAVPSAIDVKAIVAAEVKELLGEKAATKR